jgi:4-aminobutyrate aminotransferase-like enzyme
MVALEVIDVIESEGLLENATARGAQLHAGLAAIAAVYAQAVPAHVRHGEEGVGVRAGRRRRKARHDARNETEARAAGRLLGALEEQLHAEADAH